MRPIPALSLFGVCILAMAAIPSAATRIVSFTIEDTFPPPPGTAGVFSDQAESGTNVYQDYRIDPDPGYVNWCVDAEPYSAGNLFVRLNRKLDGDAGVLRCSEHERPDGQLGVQRNVVLRINSDQACDILSDPGAGLPLIDASGLAWDPSSSSAPCTLSRSDNPRIRLGTLYKSRAKGTRVDFLTEMFGSPNSYEIRSDSEAPISSNGPGHKGITYTGTFKLVKFQPGQKARTVGQAFSMPLQMNFYEH